MAEDGDGLQLGVAVFCVAVSLVVTMMLPMVLPGQSDAIDWQEVYGARSELEGFTGASMVDQSPWQLSGVYLPYVQGEEFEISDNWLTGPSVEYSQIGEYTGIRLDPAFKSSVPLAVQKDVVTVNTGQLEWYWSNWGAPGASGTNVLYDFSNWVSQSLGWGTINPYIMKTAEYPLWEYSGYRYEFSPILKINTTGGENDLATDDGKLSIVWYDTYGTEGISGGLMLYSNTSQGLIANITAAEITADYSRDSAYASSYVLDFDGVQVNMYIRFDPDVVTSSWDLMDAWSQGHWTLAFSITSASNLIDIENSMANSISIGNMIESYAQIMTFSVPGLNVYWDAVLYILCVMPLQLVMILFFSRFGIAGLSAGIIGSVLMIGAGVIA